MRHEFRAVQEAILETLRRRGTPYERDLVIFQDEFINSPDKQREWGNYLRRIKGNAPSERCHVTDKIIFYTGFRFNL